MKKIAVGNGAFSASEIVLGCMRITALSDKDAQRLIGTALEQGIDFFDHADIYAGGKAEEVFGRAMRSLGVSRDRIFLQTKCGIVRDHPLPAGQNICFDFSKEHILESVDGSLRRLGTDYVDVLLLHRPDALMEPEEVAEAFRILHEGGKVRFFGVSNQNPMQMELLARYLDQRIVINQLQFGVMHTGMVDSGICVNMKNPGACDRDGSVLDYCRLRDVTVQAWSPFQSEKGVFLGNDAYPEVNRVIGRIAAEKGVADTAGAVAWILRHPAKIQPIVGTTNPERLKETCKAAEIELSRQEWYEIYRAAGNSLP